MEFIDQEVQSHERVRTSTALIFIAAFALILSWLAVYAATNALIAADVIKAWPKGKDPRPLWMLSTFAGLFVSLGALGLLFSWSSNRQLKRIDAMADAEDTGP